MRNKNVRYVENLSNVIAIHCDKDLYIKKPGEEKYIVYENHASPSRVEYDYISQTLCVVDYTDGIKLMDDSAKIIKSWPFKHVIATKGCIDNTFLFSSSEGALMYNMKCDQLIHNPLYSNLSIGKKGYIVGIYNDEGKDCLAILNSDGEIIRKGPTDGFDGISVRKVFSTQEYMIVDRFGDIVELYWAKNFDFILRIKELEDKNLRL